MSSKDWASKTTGLDTTPEGTWSGLENLNRMIRLEKNPFDLLSICFTI